MEENIRREIQSGYKKKAVVDIKQAIQIGDVLEFKFIYLENGKRRRASRIHRGHVKAKYPYIMAVEMCEGRGSQRTVQYVEVLIGDVEWKRRRQCNENTCSI